MTFTSEYLVLKFLCPPIITSRLHSLGSLFPTNWRRDM